MARSITDPDRQASALTAVAGALAGQVSTSRPEAMARSITDPFMQAHALAAVVEALAQDG